MKNSFKEEYNRLLEQFKNSDAEKLALMDSLISQAAVERVLLDKLNEQALEHGLVKIHPENATIQRALPVSGQIAKHSAALTNIMDKLMKHLEVEAEEEDELADFQ